jgi:arsenite methyltransferase
MAERAFVENLERAGFEHVEVLEQTPFGVDDCERYPLFTVDLIALMRKLIPPERQDVVAVSVVIRAVLRK